MSGFIQRAKAFGIPRILSSKDLGLAIIVTIALIVFFTIHPISVDTSKDLLQDIASASITITTIVLAGFAIIISFSDDGFIAMLKRINVFSNTIFIFEYTTILAITSYLLSIFLKYIYFNTVIFYINIFVFLYLLFALVTLVIFISDLGVKKSEFIELTKEKEKLLKEHKSRDTSQ